MIRNCHFRRLLGGALLAVVTGLAAAPPDGDAENAPHRAQPEDLSHWQWSSEVKLPAGAGKDGLVDFIVPPAVFGHANPDLGDLRLVDAGGKTVPYALRIRTPHNDQQPLPQRTFDRVVNADRSISISVDLGEAPPQHNEIAVALGDNGYGRPLRLEGSADGKTWSTLLDGVYAVHIQVGGQWIDQRRFTYPPSRLRYLRVHIRPDRVLVNDEPKLESVQVFHRVLVPGELVTLPARLEQREPVRMYGEYASAWLIDLGENNIPCERLSLEAEEQGFARQFTLELFEQGMPPQPIVSGELRHAPGDRSNTVAIDLRQPVTTRRLRLVIQDARNPPLTLTGVAYTAAARQVVFAIPAGVKPPLRLYYGNPNAAAPRYDFAFGLPVRLMPAPARTQLAAAEPNPQYVPPPRPWTDRWPWLVDAVLGAACVVLLAILIVLARGAIRKHDLIQTAP